MLLLTSRISITFGSFQNSFHNCSVNNFSKKTLNIVLSVILEADFYKLDWVVQGKICPPVMFYSLRKMENHFYELKARC